MTKTKETTEYADQLNHLSARLHDSCEGYRKVSAEVMDPKLRREFRSLASEREDMTEELDGVLSKLGCEPSGEGSTLGEAHRYFIDIKGRLGGVSRESILAEVVRGESALEEAYDQALRVSDLPAELKRVVAQQHRSVRACRNRFREIAGSAADMTGKFGEKVSESVAMAGAHPVAMAIGAVMLGVAVSQLVRRRSSY